MRNIFSPGLFALVLVCFLLPFVSVSCGSYKMVTVSGRQLITGVSSSDVLQTNSGNNGAPTLVPRSGEGSGAPVDSTDADILRALAVVSALCALMGVLVAFVRLRRRAAISAVLAAAGVLSLVLVQVIMTSDFSQFGQRIQSAAPPGSGLAGDFSNSFTQLSGSIASSVHLDWEYGYWLAIILFVMAFLVNVVPLGRWQLVRVEPSAAIPVPEDTPPGP